MSLEVNTGRNNNRDATWLQNDNSIEMPLSPSSSESNATSCESTSSEETSVENTDVENQIVNRYVPPTPLSENETINPFVIGSIQNVLDNCNTSVIPFRDNTNNVIGTHSEELQNYDLDCPICFDALDTSDVITMDCCKKQIHLKCINEWHMKNIDSQTKDLCIMCRTKSELMNDIYNTLTITIYDEEDEENMINSIMRDGIRRRRRRRRKCDPTVQHGLFAAIFAFILFVFIIILSGGSLTGNNNSNRTRHH